MKCPHCTTEIYSIFSTKDIIVNSLNEYWSVKCMNCPNEKCLKSIIYLQCGEREYFELTRNWINKEPFREFLVEPLSISRNPIPPEVDNKSIVDDYKEACMILNLSPKASAALARRCLQNILREKAGVKKDDLIKEIAEVVDSGKLPSHISDNLDYLRLIGNYAAHPNKSKITGEILEVEPGEAEWCLDIIESLFDYYYVQPAKSKVRREEIDKKLGKSMNNNGLIK